MIPLLIYLSIIFIIGSYVGVFRHHSNLDADYSYNKMDPNQTYIESNKAEDRSDINIVVTILITIITVIACCFTITPSASVWAFVLMHALIYQLGYNITRGLLKDNKQFKGFLSFNQSPLTFRLVINEYTVIDWMAFLLIVCFALGLWLYCSYNF